MQPRGIWRNIYNYAPPGYFAIFRPFELNSDDFNFFVFLSIIAKQCEGSWIKCMCIYYLLTVTRLPGSERACASCMVEP